MAGRFKLAYLVRNTIMNLTTQDEQVACFGNVAAQLEPRPSAGTLADLDLLPGGRLVQGLAPSAPERKHQRAVGEGGGGPGHQSDHAAAGE